MLKSLADSKRAYHVVEATELEKIAKTVHHQGICLVAKIRKPLSFATWLSNTDKTTQPSHFVP